MIGLATENPRKGHPHRTIDRLSDELAAVITASAGERKVIIVSHSLGGLIARSYAVKNPLKIAALLFLDPSHESANHWTQDEEDSLYEATKKSNGAASGVAQEVRALREDLDYMLTLPNLPDVPVTVITSMQTAAGTTSADKQA